MAAERLNLRKIMKKNELPRIHKGDEAETSQKYSLASIESMFLLLLLMYFGCYGNLKFDIDM